MKVDNCEKGQKLMKVSQKLSTRQKQLLVGSVAVLISACDSTGTNVTLIDQPEMTNIMDVPELARQAAASPTTKQGNLLTNGSFENQLEGWGSCNNNSAITFTDRTTDGQNAAIVTNRNCIQQGVVISPGDQLTLSCDARMVSNNNEWTGLGFSFYDDDWNFVDEPDAAIVNGKNFNRYTISATAPQSSRNLGVWLYTENRASLDNCVLTTGSTPPPPPPPPEGSYQLGDTGPAGGIIFYVSDDGMSGLEAAPNETDSGGQWCRDELINIGTYGVDIPGVDNVADRNTPDSHSGRFNTPRIKAVCDASGTAASIASNYVWPNGQTDGFLPNKDQLLQLYNNKALLGDSFPPSGPHWSSTEINAGSAWSISFFIENAQLGSLPKAAGARVRSVRSFGGSSGRDYAKTYILPNSRYDTNVDGFFSGYDEWRNSYSNTPNDLFLLDGSARPDGLTAGWFSMKRHENYLYLWVTTPKTLPAVSDSYPVDGSLWEDDSFEIYFNLGNDTTIGFDSNDYLKIFSYGLGDVTSRGFTIDPVTVTGANSQKQLTHFAQCNTASPFHELECELRFDLAEMGLTGQDSAEFGFDIQWNIDEDGGSRESKWSWCSGSTLTAWQDMSTVDCSFIVLD